MSFTLDFSHVPSIPGLPTEPPSINGISEKSKDIMNRFTSDPGSLFQNPLTNSADFFGSSVTRLETQIKSIADGSAVNPSITQTEAQDFINQDGFEEVRTAIGNFMMHTGRLSGLLKSYGLDQPGLKDIMSIGTQMQNMMTLVNAGKGCLPVLGGATGLFSGDIINGYGDRVGALFDQVSAGVATIANITETLQDITQLIQGIISKDSLFLQSCVNQLQTAATGLAMEALNSNPCAHFIFEQISNRNPGGLLNVLGKPIAKI